MTALGRADVLDDPRFADWFQRKENEAALRAIIEEALAGADAKTWEKRLNDAGAPCASIWQDRGGHRPSADRGPRRDADGGYALRPPALCGSGFQLAHGGGRLDRMAPELGADTDAVLGEHGVRCGGDRGVAGEGDRVGWRDPAPVVPEQSASAIRDPYRRIALWRRLSCEPSSNSSCGYGSRDLRFSIRFCRDEAELAATARTTTPARHLTEPRRRLSRDLLRLRPRLRLHLLRADRQHELIVVIGDAVDAGGDRVPGEFTDARGGHQRQHGIDIVAAAVEPALEIARADGDGHAVMQRGEILARRRRDDRDGVELLTVRPDPGLEYRGKAERRAVGAVDEEGLLAAIRPSSIRNSRRPGSGRGACELRS